MLFKLDLEYTIQSELSQGAEGTVYKGQLKGYQGNVAIKQYKKEIAPTELQILKKFKDKPLKHQIQILRILEKEQIVIMELADGNLKELIETELYQKLNPQQINLLFLQVVLCVAEFHEQGYVHRDLKHLNILYQGQLNKSITFKLCDQGCAVKLSKRINTAFIGSTGFMAPEGANSNNVLHPSFDIWPLGIIFCHMHKIPKVETISDISKSQEKIDQFIKKQQLNEEVKELILKLLRSNPAERLEMEELKKQIRSISSKECQNLQENQVSNNNQVGKNDFSRAQPQPQLQQNYIYNNQFPFFSQYTPQVKAGQFPYQNSSPIKQINQQANPNPQFQFNIQQTENRNSQRNSPQNILNPNPQKLLSYQFLNQPQANQKQCNNYQNIEFLKQNKSPERQFQSAFNGQQPMNFLNQQKPFQICQPQINILEINRQQKEEEKRKEQKEQEQKQQQQEEREIERQRQQMEKERLQKEEREQELQRRQEMENQRLQKEIEEKQKELQRRQQMEEERLKVEEERLQKEKEQNEKEKQKIEMERQMFEKEKLQKEQEDLRQLQLMFDLNKKHVISLIFWQQQQLNFFQEELQQEKVKKLSDSNEIQNQILYIQLLDQYIEETENQIKEIDQDQSKVQLFDIKQNDQMQNYSNQYQQALQNLPQSINDKKTQLQQFWNQIQQIDKLKQEFDKKLQQVKMTQEEIMEFIKQKQRISELYNQFDPSKKLHQLINQLNMDVKQSQNDSIQLDQNIKLQESNDTKIHHYELGLQQLNQAAEKIQKFEQTQEIILNLEASIEKDLKEQQLKIIGESIDLISDVLETRVNVNQGFFQIFSFESEIIIQKLQIEEEKLKKLFQQLTNQWNCVIVLPQTIAKELQKIKTQYTDLKQKKSYIQDLRIQLNNLIEQEQMLIDLNNKRQGLEKEAENSFKQKQLYINSLIRTVNELKKNCETSILQTQINSQCLNLEGIYQNAVIQFASIVETNSFRTEQDFCLFKSNLDSFLQNLQEKIEREEKYVCLLEKLIEAEIIKQHNESKQLFHQASKLFDQLSRSLKFTSDEYQKLQSFEKYKILSQFQQQKEELQISINNLEEMLQIGKEDKQILENLINQKQTENQEPNLQKTLQELNNQLTENLEILQHKLDFCKNVEIPIKYIGIDLQKETENIENEKQEIQQLQSQLEQDFKELKIQKEMFNNQFKVYAVQFIEKYQEYMNALQTQFKDKLQKWNNKIADLNQAMRSLIISKIVVYLIKLYHLIRYAQRLTIEFKKTKQMSQIQRLKLQDKKDSDSEKLQEIIQFELKETHHYSYMLQGNGIQIVNFEDTLASIQKNWMNVQEKENFLLNYLTTRNSIKVNRTQQQKESKQRILNNIPKLEFMQGKMMKEFGYSLI